MPAEKSHHCWIFAIPAIAPPWDRSLGGSMEGQIV